MSNSANRVRLQTVDWAGVFPVVRLASAFRFALQPGKLLIAFIAVLILHFGGVGLGELWQSADDTGAREDLIVEPGIYQEFMRVEARSFRRMISAAAGLDFGLSGEGRRQSGVLGAALEMGIYNPLGLIRRHPGFAATYGLFALLILSLAGGVISRMAATQACGNLPSSVSSALKFVQPRVAWFLLTPLMPLALMAVLGLVLVLAGLIFFNAGFLDIIGSLLYGPLLLIGFLIAVIAIAFFFAVHLLTPALAVEGTDGFDAISRAMNYVLFKPWQVGFYFVAAAVYAAAAYLVVGGVAELTLGGTATLVDAGSFAESRQFSDASRFEAIQRQANLPIEENGGEDWAAAWMMARWTELVWAIVVAFMLSLYFSLQTLVYLLIRRSADGTPYEEYAASGTIGDLWSSPEDVLATDKTQKPEPSDTSDGS